MPVDTARPIVPIPAADPFFVSVLRSALEAYIRGDYTRASHFWQDAAAINHRRPDAGMWALLGAELDLLVEHQALANRNASL